MNEPALVSPSFRPYIRKTLIGLTGIAATGFLFATLLTLFARSFWVGEIFASLRIQLICGLLPVFGLALTLKHRSLIAGTAALVICNLWFCRSAVISSASNPPAHLSSATAAPCRMATFNVYSGNRRTDMIVQQIRDANADVIAILELTHELADSLREEFADEYPEMIFQPQSDGNFGIGLMSRLAVESSTIFVTHEDWLPSISADIRLDSTPVTVIATHPVPPMFRRGYRLRNAQLESISRLSRRLQKPEEASLETGKEPREVIILGDLNLTPWSPVFQDFCRDADVQCASAGTGLTPTWYRYPLFPFGLVIDHGLFSGGLTGQRTQVFPDAGSDHRLVLFEFQKKHDAKP